MNGKIFLAIDIGNTNVTLGGLAGDRVLFQARVETGHVRDSGGFAMELRQILVSAGISPGTLDGCAISSVVPPALEAVQNAAAQVTGKPPLVVGPGLETGVPLHVDRPERVGTDRVVLAAAALSRYSPPLLLVDMGTATTVDAVDRDGIFQGGCILPGVRTSLDALSARAAQLPAVTLEPPGGILGKDTVSCMRGGVMYGAAAALDGILDRMEEALGEPALAIATGGIAPLILPLCRREILLEENLLLEGLQILYEKNRPADGGRN